jgi:hypothetical protein
MSLFPLISSDLYYPGWKVKVNGKGEEIVKAGAR